jgi:hypothetical protein
MTTPPSPAGRYSPRPVDTSGIELPPELQELTERIAANVHDVWAAGRIADGWQYGPVRDDARKLHPCLVPYDQLPDAEKEYDRQTAMQTLKLIRMIGFDITKGQLPAEREIQDSNCLNCDLYDLHDSDD